MNIHQISVFLENRTGQLSEITRLLAENHVDIRAISIAESSDYGLARMIVDDSYKASQIETVLLQQGYPANYQIIVDRVNNSDTFEVVVEMTPEIFSDSLAKIAEMEKELVGALKAMLGIMAKVKLVAPKTIARSEGKAVRIIDKRKI